MKIKLLIASDDGDYIEHLSKELLNNYSDGILVNICSSAQRLDEISGEQKFDVILLEASFCEGLKTDAGVLYLVLWDESLDIIIDESFQKIRKYQRISSIYTDILESYAKVSTRSLGINSKKADITVVWSPTGGVGKTTVALAYAASKVSEDKQVMYLNLELFSGTSVYFDTSGKSISALFEMLEAKTGNIEVLIKSMLRRDPGSNIFYFCCPRFFDDINILSVDNISSLISACEKPVDEVIIDMSCVCDERTRYIFDVADRVLIVNDATCVSRAKTEQFINHQHLFSQIKDKVCFIANKGASATDNNLQTISLPYVQTTRESEVYKILSVSFKNLRTEQNG